MNLLRKSLGAAVRFFKQVLLANPKLRGLLYELANKEEFTDLYEHEKMLADSVRVSHYQRAIKKHVGTDDVVLDLGTGTGILSFFAAQQHAKKIYAIDHSDFIDVARIVGEHNKFDNIEFIKTNSKNFKPDVKFDLIIHEQMGDYLFNENMVSNLLDLKKRLLKPAGKILPGKFELFLEPVDLREAFDIPFLWENKSYGVDFGCLEKHYELLEQHQPATYKQEWLEANAVKEFLCEMDPILTFDLNDLNSEQEIPKVFEITKKIVNSGTFDGFCLFFKVHFDDEIQFDTSPFGGYTHWGNCFFRIESRQCSGGEIVSANLNMRDFLDIKTWSVTLKRFKEATPQRV